MFKKEFGETSSGETISLYTLENTQGFKMVISNFGAVLTQLWVPDKDGKLRDVVLGYDSVIEYESNPTYFGSTIGRSANRIAEASFELEGNKYQLNSNEGNNSLHSGPNGYHLRIWDVVEVTNDKVTFSLVSPDKDQGYPGNLIIKVTYELTDSGIKLTYTGKTDQTTLFNPTNHTYFNLNGHNNGTIMNHYLEIYGHEFTPYGNEDSIPTGEIASVLGSPMDFTKIKRIGKHIDEDYSQLQYTDGYDHNYVLNSESLFFAKLVGEKSGITMRAGTNLPGVQFYSGNFIDELPGKEGVVYQKRDGLCLETQFYPNAVNTPQFPSPILESNKEVTYWTTFTFFNE